MELPAEPPGLDSLDYFEYESQLRHVCAKDDPFELIDKECVSRFSRTCCALKLIVN